MGSLEIISQTICAVRPNPPERLSIAGVIGVIFPIQHGIFHSCILPTKSKFNDVVVGGECREPSARDAGVMSQVPEEGVASIRLEFEAICGFTHEGDDEIAVATFPDINEIIVERVIVSACVNIQRSGGDICLAAILQFLHDLR